jgi:dTDP-4-dehydrorhamnose reductase
MTAILVIGGTGQIGRALIDSLAPLGVVHAPSRAAFDLTQPDAVRDAIRALQPAIIVNAAGYTAVDRAEGEPELCAALNADAPALIAEEAHRLNAVLVHFSTDYVFAGMKGSPYVETDTPAPLSVYGRTKLAGERAIINATDAALILRTSWVYSAHRRNFVRAILDAARSGRELRVVNDQTGAPTSAVAIARGVARVLTTLSSQPSVRAVSGIYHMSAGGSTTWFDFARTILADCNLRATVTPVSTAAYGAIAARPAYSVLDNTKFAHRFGFVLDPWVHQWRQMVSSI